MHPAKATPELAASRILVMEDEEDNVRALAQRYVTALSRLERWLRDM